MEKIFSSYSLYFYIKQSHLKVKYGRIPLLLLGSRCVLAIMSGKLWKEEKHWRSGNTRHKTNKGSVYC